MSPKLPINNSQTITDYLNLKKSEISEESSDESYKFAFDDEAFLARRETIGIRFELELLKPEILLHEHGIEIAYPVRIVISNSGHINRKNEER